MMSDLSSLSPIFIIITNQIKYPQSTYAKSTCTHGVACLRCVQTKIFFRWQKQESKPSPRMLNWYLWKHMKSNKRLWRNSPAIMCNLALVEQWKMQNWLLGLKKGRLEKEKQLLTQSWRRNIGCVNKREKSFRCESVISGHLERRDFSCHFNKRRPENLQEGYSYLDFYEEQYFVCVTLISELKVVL